MIYFSAERKGFFDTSYDYPNLPSDLVAVTKDQHQQLLQANYDGMEICVIDGVVVARHPSFTDEQLSMQVREKRNALLRTTDWTQTPDVPESTRTKYAAYRQSLRDIPQQSGFPIDIEWPSI